MPDASTQPNRPSDEAEARLAIAETIERGRADARAGRVVPHGEVMR